MSGDDPRWTICVDGDAVEIALRPTGSPWVWVPTILFLPVPLVLAAYCAFLVRWIVRYGGPLHGPLDVFGLVFGTVTLSVAALWCLRIAVKEIAWLSWIWTGLERTTVAADHVRIERDGFGICSDTTIARLPAGALRARPRPRLGDVLSFRWGLPRPGRAGALSVDAPGRPRGDSASPASGTADATVRSSASPTSRTAEQTVRFGLDLTVPEAEAILAEIDLIRGASARRGVPSSPDASDRAAG